MTATETWNHAEPLDPHLADKHLVRLVAPGDIDGLVIALMELLEDQTARICLRDAGRAFIHSFTWSAIAKAHLEVYQKISHW